MDPITILGIVSKALSLSKDAFDTGLTVHKFVKQAKKVDQTLEAFAEEINALGASCSLVSTRIGSLIEKFDAQESSSSKIGKKDELWSYLDYQLSACQTAVTRLKDVFGKTLDSEGDLNALQKALKQLDLNFKMSDITEARNRIKSHTTSLQTVLLCIGIEVSYLAPHRADQHLQPLLIELRDIKGQLSSILKKEPDEQNELENESAILAASDRIISSGETLYESSVSGGSVFGPDSVKMTAIHGWIQDMATNGHSDVDVDTTNSSQQQDTDHTAPTSITREDDETGNIDPRLDEDDFTLDLTKQSLALGKEFFDQEKWHEAEEMLLEAKKLFAEVSIRQQKLCDISNMQYMLAVCSFATQSNSVAKRQLVAYLDTATRTPYSNDSDTAKNVCDIGRLLVLTCVGSSELDQARTYAENTVTSCSRVFGKTSRKTYSSLVLLARTLELQGHLTRAKIMIAMVPESEELSDHAIHVNGLLVHTINDIDENSDKKVELKKVEEAIAETVRDNNPPDTALDHAADEQHSTKELVHHIPSTMDRPHQELIGKPQKPLDAQIGLDDRFRSQDLQQWVKKNNYHYKADQATALNLRGELKRLHSSSKAYFGVSQALLSGKDEKALKLAGNKAFGPLFGQDPYGLHIASAFGVVEVVQALVSAGCNVHHELRIISSSFLIVDDNNRKIAFEKHYPSGYETVDKTGITYKGTPLQYAAQAGHHASVKILLAAGASVDDRGSLFGTPLVHAISRKSLETIETLIAGGADIVAPCRYWLSPLHYACQCRNVHYVMALQPNATQLKTIRVNYKNTGLAEIWNFKGCHDNCGCNFNVDAFGIAALGGQVAVMEYLITKDIKTRRQYIWQPGAHTGTTARNFIICATVLAVNCSHYNAVRWMIKNKHACLCTTALAIAMKRKEEAIACLLWDEGARPDMWTEQEAPPILPAASSLTDMLNIAMRNRMVDMMTRLQKEFPDEYARSRGG